MWSATPLTSRCLTSVKASQVELPYCLAMDVLPNDTSDHRPDAQLRRAILASNQDPIPRYLVVQVFLGVDGGTGMLHRLYREIEIVATLLARDRVVTRLHLVESKQAPMTHSDRGDLLRMLAQHFALSADVLAAIDHSPVRGVPAENKFDILGLGPGAISRIGGTQFISVGCATAYCLAVDAGRLPTMEPHRSETRC